MGYMDNFNSRDFWMDVLKLGVVFFLVFVVISVIISHFRQLMAGDFQTIYEDEWADGQWQNYFGIKAAISFVYAVYMTSRRRRMAKNQQ